MNLVSPLERQLSSRTDIDHPKMIFKLSASLEIVLVCAPLPIPPRSRPLPEDIAALVRSIAAKRLTRSALVVSHHLDGLLRSQASGLLHPETG